MKTICLPKCLATALLIVAAVSLTNCSNDTSENEIESLANLTSHNAKETLCVQYRLELAQAWYDLYDIEISFVDITGAVTTRTVTKNSIYEASMLKENAATDFYFYVTAKPKATTVEVDDSLVYDLHNYCAMNVYCYKGSVSDASPAYNLAETAQTTIEGRAISSQLGQERLLFSASYSL